jgi:hypothetical protein
VNKRMAATKNVPIISPFLIQNFFIVIVLIAGDLHVVSLDFVAINFYSFRGRDNPRLLVI